MFSRLRAAARVPAGDLAQRDSLRRIDIVVRSGCRPQPGSGKFSPTHLHAVARVVEEPNPAPLLQAIAGKTAKIATVMLLLVLRSDHDRRPRSRLAPAPSQGRARRCAGSRAETSGSPEFPITRAVRASVGAAEAVFAAKHAAAITQIDKPSRDRRGVAMRRVLIICSRLSDWVPLTRCHVQMPHPNSSNAQIFNRSWLDSVSV